MLLFWTMWENEELLEINFNDLNWIEECVEEKMYD